MLDVSLVPYYFYQTECLQTLDTGTNFKASEWYKNKVGWKIIYIVNLN